MASVALVAFDTVFGALLVVVGFRLCRRSSVLRHGLARFLLALVGWVIMLVGGLGLLLHGVAYGMISVFW
ncbi:MAG TPA: hypothetical protein VJ553_00915 [Candidatus Paceibacterota bacterium]|nr:hypothetical protein [Candidatus Paceibacterota bacterium]